MTQQSLSLETFFRDTLQDIEKKIVEIIKDENIIYILEGGKRLRPLLASLSFKVCTGGKETSDLYQKALEGAVGVELAHNASLVHDDIIDQDSERRGKPSFYVKEGIDNAILTGHKMLAIGADLGLSHSNKIAELFVYAWRKTLEGQLREVNFSSKDLNDSTNISQKSKFFQAYSEIIDLKTASLFSSACQAGALEANGSEQLAKLLGDYGREVGFAYQLADDIVDLEKGEMIDSVVIPLLTRLEKKSMKNGSMTVKAIKKKLDKNFPEIKQLYLDEIAKHVMNAQDLITADIVPNSQYKKLLQNAPAHIINKMLQEINITI